MMIFWYRFWMTDYWYICNFHSKWFSDTNNILHMREREREQEILLNYVLSFCNSMLRKFITWSQIGPLLMNHLTYYLSVQKFSNIIIFLNYTLIMKKILIRMTYFFVFLQSIFYVKLIDTPYQIQGSCQNVC